MSLRAIAGVLLALMLAAALGALVCTQIHQARAARQAQAPGAVDIGFAQSMSLHHQQAIWMSQQLLDGRPTALATLARTLLAAQLLELGEMRGWLGLWGQPLRRSVPDMDWMLLGDAPLEPDLARYLLDCQRAPTGMVGLASLAELDRLRTSTDLSRDEYFLRLMLAHHEGGIPMARFAAAQARLAVVRDLATRIALEQSREIGQIRQMLEALGASAD